MLVLSQAACSGTFPSRSAVTMGKWDFFSFSCVGGRDQSMWCSVSLIIMTWLFCYAMVSEWWMRIETLNFVLPGSWSLWSWTELSLDESVDLTAVHACGCIFVCGCACVRVIARQKM